MKGTAMRYRVQPIEYSVHYKILDCGGTSLAPDASLLEQYCVIVYIITLLVTSTCVQ